jgi:rhodanese-related sulfurtransferase
MVKENIISDLTPKEFNDYIHSKQNIKDYMIIDLRSPVKFGKNRLSNAVNIDYDYDNFETEIEKLDRKKVYLVYCSWSSKSNIVCEMMADLEFTKTYKMVGGINAWNKDGFPLEHDE